MTRETTPNTPSDPVESAVHGVFEGEPWQDLGKGNWMLAVPHNPHVFSARVRLRSHDEYVDMPGEPKILLAHGYRNAEGAWTFRDGRPVADIVEAYNSIHHDDPIRVLAVCNPDGTAGEAETAGVWHALGSNLRIAAEREDDQTLINISMDNTSTAANHSPQEVIQALIKNVAAKSKTTRR